MKVATVICKQIFSILPPQAQCLEALVAMHMDNP